MKPDLPIQAVIIEDEPDALEILEAKLTSLFPNQLYIIATAESVNEAYPLIISRQPDLIFLDIAMAGESGFDLLNKLPKLDFEIIFVTGFSDYAIEALKFCAIGYVTKPILDDDLIHAFHNAQKRISEKQMLRRNTELLINLKNPGNLNNRISIPTSEGLEFIPVKEIIRCEGVQGCTKIVIKGRKSIISSYNIGQYRRLLKNYKFYAPHKSHLIHLLHIQSYKKEGTIVMSDEATIPLARGRKNEFLEFLNSD